jgi:positive regulator of sigma E activity
LGCSAGDRIAEAGQVSTLAISQIKQTASSVLRYLMPLFCLMGAALSWVRRNKKKRR